jgi:phenylalanyl-tRNA synthetase beta chain
MKFTISWLKRFLNTSASLRSIVESLTMLGFEVNNIDDKKVLFDQLEVAQVLEVKRTQNSNIENLSFCRVQLKSKIITILCGAKNVRVGMKVVVAKVEFILQNFEAQMCRSKIVQLNKDAILCTKSDLNLGIDSYRIIELPKHAIVGSNLSKYLGFYETVIDINVTPNRTDAFGVYGIARDLAAAGVGTLRSLDEPIISNEFRTHYTLCIREEKVCKLYAIREINGITNVLSPKWLQILLDNIGVGSVSALVDVVNYISYTFGQPIHIYNANNIGRELIIDTLKFDTSFEASDNNSYDLECNDIVIKDKNKIHSLAGIIGSKISECNKSTNHILLEAASFNSDYIAKSGRRLMIDTRSRYLFERNVDRSFVLKALDFASLLLTSICGGVISNSVVVGDANISPKTICFPIACFKSKTNIDLSADVICSILGRLGFKTKVIFSNIITIVPSWRYDISFKEDLVEEVLRIYGYDKIPETPLPAIVSNTLSIPWNQKVISDIKRILVSVGYKEVVTWSFMDRNHAAWFSKVKEELTILNPISIDLAYMRPSILPNLLKLASNNINRSLRDLSLFEVGPVFNDIGDKMITHVSGIRLGYNTVKNSYNTRRLFDVFDVKADIESILGHIGINFDDYTIQFNVASYYHPMRSATVYLGDNMLGTFGQVCPKILRIFSIDLIVLAFEINISALQLPKVVYGKKREFIRSNYQVINRDYAFIVEVNQPVGQLINFIYNIDKTRIKSVCVFDIYYGDKIDNDKKSVAFSVLIHDQKTFLNSDINIISEKIISGMEQKFNAILRYS